MTYDRRIKKNPMCSKLKLHAQAGNIPQIIYFNFFVNQIHNYIYIFYNQIIYQEMVKFSGMDQFGIVLMVLSLNF